MKLIELREGDSFVFQAKQYTVVWNDRSGRMPLVKCLDGGPPCETLPADTAVEKATNLEPCEDAQ